MLCRLLRPQRITSTMHLGMPAVHCGARLRTSAATSEGLGDCIAVPTQNDPFVYTLQTARRPAGAEGAGRGACKPILQLIQSSRVTWA